MNFFHESGEFFFQNIMQEKIRFAASSELTLNTAFAQQEPVSGAYK